MTGLHDYGAFVLGSLLIVLLPGPNSMFVLTTAGARGIAAGYRAALGVFFGDTVLMLASVGGVASLLATTPTLFAAVKYVGAAYLAWIGLRLVLGGVARWRGAPDGGEIPDAAEPAVGGDAELARARRQRNPFLGALGLALLNPKAILFFIAFFVQFVDPTAPRAWQGFLLLGATVQVISMVYLSTLIVGGRLLAEQFRRHRRLASLGTGAIGLLFVSFAVSLATASLH